MMQITMLDKQLEVAKLHPLITQIDYLFQGFYVLNIKMYIAQILLRKTDQLLFR